MTSKVEVREQINNDAVILDGDGHGRQISASQMESQINNRPGAANFAIPGQVIRHADGSVKKIPLRAPGFPDPNTPPVGNYPPPQGYPYPYQQQQQQLQTQGGYPPQTQVVLQDSRVENLSDNKPIFHLLKVEDAFYFFLQLPGLIKESLKINIVGDRRLNIECEFQDVLELVTSMEMTKKNLQKKKKGLIVDNKSNDNRPNKFKHSYDLSSSIDKANHTAKLDNGVLHMYLPFKESEETAVNVTVL